MPTILVVDDDANLRFAFGRILDPRKYRIDEAESGEEALRKLKERSYSAVFLDLRMPGRSGLDVLPAIRTLNPKVPVIMMTAYGGTEDAIEAVKRGAYDFILKPFDVEEIRRLAEQADTAYRLMTRAVRMEVQDAELPEEADTLVGRSRPMQEVYKQIGRVASSDASVLIIGASGTGKELVARAIYHHSKRADKLFLAVNCAAIPEGLLESELFGHERGAFTSAEQRRLGKFERAHGGTLFLDEIGDMSPVTQSKILRVLQDGVIERVGGSEPITVDVRIVAATHRDLPDMVAKGTFRADLYFRLNVFTINLPSLNDRRDDIPQLVRYCVRRSSARQNKSIEHVPQETVARLMAHDWRGNVRELENVIDRAVIVTAGTTLLPESISFQETAPHPVDSAANELTNEHLLDLVFERLVAAYDDGHGPSILTTVEHEMLIRALKYLDGNQAQAASVLGMSRQTLRNRLSSRDAGSGRNNADTE
ncbi:MAG TPA: sigma-54 dependent transcriptional regulator [candidate division Zixibacteria bacterium]|jgi:DNA-binding NtrC family response regulator